MRMYDFVLLVKYLSKTNTTFPWVRPCLTIDLHFTLKSPRVPAFNGQYIVHSKAETSLLSVDFVAIRFMPVASNMEAG